MKLTREAFQQAIAPTFTAIIEHATGRQVLSFISAMNIEPLYSIEFFRLVPRTVSRPAFELGARYSAGHLKQILLRLGLELQLVLAEQLVRVRLEQEELDRDVGVGVDLAHVAEHLAVERLSRSPRRIGSFIVFWKLRRMPSTSSILPSAISVCSTVVKPPFSMQRIVSLIA